MQLGAGSGFSELQRYQPCVDSIDGHQFVVATFFAQLAVVKHEDAICLPHGTETVGDDHRCAALITCALIFS